MDSTGAGYRQGVVLQCHFKEIVQSELVVGPLILVIVIWFCGFQKCCWFDEKKLHLKKSQWTAGGKQAPVPVSNVL